MTKDYMLNRIAKYGYKTTILGKNISVKRGENAYFGKISDVYKQIFIDNSRKLITELLDEIETKNEYIKGLEELLYNKTIAEKSNEK